MDGGVTNMGGVIPMKEPTRRSVLDLVAFVTVVLGLVLLVAVGGVSVDDLTKLAAAAALLFAVWVGGRFPNR